MLSKIVTKFVSFEMVCCLMKILLRKDVKCDSLICNSLVFVYVLGCLILCAGLKWK
jgi:hypothetical protein